MTSFCDETPTNGPPRSVGAPAHGAVEGALALPTSASVEVLPRRHAERCLGFGTPRLVRAIARAGERVAREHPGSPALGVGNIGRARGGPIREYSHSHQAGRDADLAFYALSAGQPVRVTDLVSFDAGLRTRDGLELDVARTWALCRALLEDPSVTVRWLFVSNPIRAALLREAKRVSPQLVSRAAAVLHQPSDAPPHDDHLHLRISCTAEETARGCR